MSSVFQAVIVFEAIHVNLVCVLITDSIADSLALERILFLPLSLALAPHVDPTVTVPSAHSIAYYLGVALSNFFAVW